MVSEIALTPNRLLLLSWSSSSLDAVVSKVGSENSDLYRLFCEAYLALLLDSPLDREKPLSLLRKFFYNSLLADPRGTILSLSALADTMLETMSITSDYTINGEFLDEMKDTPIFREYLHFYRTGDPVVLKFILSFLQFGKKMDFLDTRLETNAFRDWLEIEQDMSDFRTPENVVECLSVIIHQLIPSIDDNILLPKHGPGYTSEGFIDPSEKLDNLSFDRKSWYAFREESFGRFPAARRASMTQWMGQSMKEQIGRVKFVPKNIKTMRSICMEPISRMYLQQEVSRWVIDAMERSPLKYLVSLRDQVPNQRYAIGGSTCYSCDTIDLKAASDRVHVELVKRTFPKKVLFYLLATRTSSVKTPIGVIKLNKFAPMGSALCFPIESIVFASITILAYLMQHYECDSVDDLSKDWYYLHHIDKFIRMMHDNPEQVLHLLRPRIYGDDIICDYRTTDRVLILLSHCGLRVNSSKSFIGGSPFRESCGVFAFNGEDVTPFLFRVPNHGNTINGAALASLYGQINNAGDHKYIALRSCLIHYVRRTRVDRFRGDNLPRILFTCDRQAFGVFSTSARVPNQARVRTNKDYQREEQEVLVLRGVSRKRVSSRMEQYAYDQWMRARIRGGSDEDNFSSSRVRPYATRIRLGWAPV